MDELISKAIDLACLNLKNNLKEAELICNQILKVENNYIAKVLLAYCKNHQIEKPNDSNFLNEVGIVFLKAGLFEKATEYFFDSLLLDEKNSHAWANLAGCYKQKKMYWVASKLLARSLNIKVEKQNLINLAQVYGEIKKIKEAKECLEKALELDKTCAAARVDLTSALFLSGDWKRPGFLYRSRYDHFIGLKKILEIFPKEKMWNGEFVYKKKIIFFSEQGIGDTFNFLRFVKLFEQKYSNNEISVFVQDELKDFVENQGFKIAIDAKKYDLCCSIMDLPWLLNLKKEDVKLKEPFIVSKKCDFSYFKNNFKIGLCWAGNAANPRDKHRSCYLKLFKKIHDIPSVKLFSLQHDLRSRIWPGEEKPIDLSVDCSDMRMVNMQPYMKNWHDTASIINELDLTISVDTSILHLAASMNKPTFGLIAYLPDWRWGLDSEDNIWYPNLKLFRQPDIDDWETPINRIKNKIEQYLN
jgi:tetratricopeptide (TPR) repeat protein